MSTIHMIEQVIDFSNSSHSLYFFNKLQTKSSILFPSNVMQCSLTVKDFMFCNGVIDATTSADRPDPGDGINSMGWGIEDVSYMSNQVFFAGWMKTLVFDKDSRNRGLPDPNTSCLTVLAVAQCE